VCIAVLSSCCTPIILFLNLLSTFRGAPHGKLQNADLENAKLQNAYLWNAQLQNANLEWANLQNAYLENANLKNADLYFAELQNACLRVAKLNNACLENANLKNADLYFAKLQNAYLREAKLNNACLREANLNNACLREANLKNADLYFAKLQNVNLKGTSLQGTYLYGVRFDSETAFDNATLYDANLFRSYFDEAKSFRHAKLFRTETGKEINELIGDALHDETTSVLDLDKIKKANPDVAAAILDNEGLVKYARDGTQIVFFDRPSGGLTKNPEKRRRREEDTVIIDGLSDLIHRGVEIQSEYLYGGSRADQFEASYEVYNNLRFTITSTTFTSTTADSTRQLTFITGEARHTESYCERRVGFTG
jgi:uncharacterized protein YjbI with pentapeptide repeats